MTSLTQVSFDFTLLRQLRQWIEAVEIHDRKVATMLCQLIPASCPFARRIQLFGHTIVQIPPLCKIKPLYEQLMELRFRALSYLADESNNDLVPYKQTT
jgi:hypothetical protein